MSDRRISKSIQSIENSFFQLIENYDVAEITIVKICEQANINRSTFYAHFEDINHFLNSLEYKMADKLFDCAKKYHYDTNATQFMDSLFDVIDNNKSLFSFMFRKESSGLCKQLFLEKLMDQTVPIWCKESDVTTEQAKIIFIFISEGMHAVLKYWCEHNYEESPETIKHLCENVAKYGAYDFIYTK